MKQLTDYITEKANFLVKKHITNNINIAMSADELEDGCYAKINTDLGSWYLFKYDASEIPGTHISDPVGFSWNVLYNGSELIANKKRRSTECLTRISSIEKFVDLNEQDYNIIYYMESHIDELTKDKNISQYIK